MLLSSSAMADDESPPRLDEEINSACSTPFVSAPSSPTNGPSGYFFSAPASPMHYLLKKEKANSPPPVDCEQVFLSSDSGSFEFEFSSRFFPTGNGGTGSMTSADELFFNGQIRPMKLSFHLQRSQEVSEVYGMQSQVHAGSRGRDLWPRYVSSKYFHRKTRSMSPFRAGATHEWQEDLRKIEAVDLVNATKENESIETTPSCSASSSRSSSSGRNSKKWMFLKDLLHRSKSEGTATTNKDRFWSAISFSSIKEKKSTPPSPALSRSSSREEKRPKAELIKARNSSASGRPTNGVWRRRIPPSAHELHYTAHRAQAEEMRKKTFLPYRQGLLACLGFNSKSYGAFNGFTKTLNPISSR